MAPPKVFVGSSSEARSHDIQVRYLLEDNDAVVVNWREVFKPGDYPLDALVAVASAVDAALLLATPDDIVISRGEEHAVPRDNILVELGFFTGALGRGRTALVYVRSSDSPTLKLPSDLNGLTVLMFDPNRTATNERALVSWLGQIRSTALAKARVWRHVSRVRESLDSLPESWLPYMMDTILSRHVQGLSTAERGAIELRPDEYYRLIYDEMDRAAAGTEVRAVASMSPARWIHTAEQKGYVERNIAAAQRGARMRRLFVLPEDVQPRVAEIAERMTVSGIEIRFARPGPWGALQKIQDMVMFSDTSEVRRRAYVAYPDADYPLRIDSAELTIHPASCLERANLFDNLWDWAAEYQVQPSVTSENRPPGALPPGHTLRRYYLDRPVVTCREAAAAKQIPRENELKTLIVESSAGVVAVHVPGDRAVKLRAVMNALKCREARLASRAKLSSLGLAPGTVCPVLDPVWYMRHLICESVLDLGVVYTNAGTLTGYFKFSPAILLRNPQVTVGRFSADT